MPKNKARIRIFLCAAYVQLHPTQKADKLDDPAIWREFPASREWVYGIYMPRFGTFYEKQDLLD